MPLACIVSAANRTDMKRREALLDARMIALPALPENIVIEERPQLRLDRDYAACRATTRAHGYVLHIPPPASTTQPLAACGHPDRHPPPQWVVEVAQAWFNRFRHLLIRREKKGQNYLALVQMVAVLIIYRKLRHAHLLCG